jgi:hypothetical protein
MSDFNDAWISKNTQMPNWMTIRPVAVESMTTDGRTDGGTDMTKLIVVFRYFANALKNARTVTC